MWWSVKRRDLGSAADDAEDDGDDDDEGHQRQRDHQHQLHLDASCFLPLLLPTAFLLSGPWRGRAARSSRSSSSGLAAAPAVGEVINATSTSRSWKRISSGKKACDVLSFWALVLSICHSVSMHVDREASEPRWTHLSNTRKRWLLC